MQVQAAPTPAPLQSYRHTAFPIATPEPSAEVTDEPTPTPSPQTPDTLPTVTRNTIDLGDERISSPTGFEERPPTDRPQRSAVRATSIAAASNARRGDPIAARWARLSTSSRPALQLVRSDPPFGGRAVHGDVTWRWRSRCWLDGRSGVRRRAWLHRDRTSTTGLARALGLADRPAGSVRRRCEAQLHVHAAAASRDHVPDTRQTAAHVVFRAQGDDQRAHPS